MASPATKVKLVLRRLAQMGKSDVLLWGAISMANAGIPALKSEGKQSEVQLLALALCNFPDGDA